MTGRTNATNYKQYLLIKKVPEEYLVIEYLLSDGQSYMDTLVSSHSNMKCELLFEFLEIPKDGCLIGTKYPTGNRERLYFYHHYQGHKLGYENYLGTGIATIGEKYHVVTTLNVGYLSLYINDNLIYLGNNNNYLNTRLNFYIFNLNTNGLEDGKYFTKAKLYYCKIWDNNELIRYFIPVYRIEDNIPGLYDIINQEFYTNLGNGTFIVGPDSKFDIDNFKN